MRPADPVRGGGGGTTVLPCVADGYVRDGTKYERTCFVSETALVTKRPDITGSGYGRTAFVCFQLPPLGGQVQLSMLRVSAVSGDGGGRTVVNVHTADSNWDEATLCAASAPTPSAQPLTSMRVGGFACYLAWDVTSYVAEALGNGASRVAFALLNAEPSEKTNQWGSRRAGADTAPQLELTA